MSTGGRRRYRPTRRRAKQEVRPREVGAMCVPGRVPGEASEPAGAGPRDPTRFAITPWQVCVRMHTSEHRPGLSSQRLVAGCVRPQHGWRGLRLCAQPRRIGSANRGSTSRVGGGGWSQAAFLCEPEAAQPRLENEGETRGESSIKTGHKESRSVTGSRRGGRDGLPVPIAGFGDLAGERNGGQGEN